MTTSTDKIFDSILNVLRLGFYSIPDAMDKLKDQAFLDTLKGAVKPIIDSEVKSVQQVPFRPATQSPISSPTPTFTPTLPTPTPMFTPTSKPFQMPPYMPQGAPVQITRPARLPNVPYENAWKIFQNQSGKSLQDAGAAWQDMDFETKTKYYMISNENKAIAYVNDPYKRPIPAFSNTTAREVFTLKNGKGIKKEFKIADAKLLTKTIGDCFSSISAEEHALWTAQAAEITNFERRMYDDFVQRYNAYKVGGAPTVAPVVPRQYVQPKISTSPVNLSPQIASILSQAKPVSPVNITPVMNTPVNITPVIENTHVIESTPVIAPVIEVSEQTQLDSDNIIME